MRRNSLLITLSLFFNTLIGCASSKNDIQKNTNSATANKEKSDFFYSYSSKFPEHFNIYQKVSGDSIFTHFKIYHQKSAIRNDDLWRVLEGNLVRYDGSKMTPFQQILTNGENEFVWRSARQNVGDFTGGYHGDERIDIAPESKVTFYANGKAIDTQSDIQLTKCNSFYYHQFSTMHQSGTGAADMSKPGYIAIPDNPIDGYHEKKTTFENNGFTTYNKITWATKVPIDKCYFGILCVNKEISSEGINEDNLTSIFNENGGNKLTSDKQKIVMKSDKMGITVTCDAKIINLPFIPSLTTFIWDNQNYHKYYSTIKTTTANQNDVWETVASISFSYTKKR